MAIELRSANLQGLVTVLSDPMPIVAQILGFLRLPDGWHFGIGQAPTGRTVVSALSIAHALREVGLARLEAFPDSDGGILVAGYHGDESIEILCRPTGQYDFVHEKDGHDLEHAPDLDKTMVNQKIGRRRWREESSSTFSIPSLLAEKKAGTQALLSKISAEAYPSFILNAPRQQVARYARTSADTTRHQSQVTRRSSGDLTRIFFRRATA